MRTKAECFTSALHLQSLRWFIFEFAIQLRRGVVQFQLVLNANFKLIPVMPLDCLLLQLFHYLCTVVCTFWFHLHFFHRNANAAIIVLCFVKDRFIKRNAGLVQYFNIIYRQVRVNNDTKSWNRILSSCIDFNCSYGFQCGNYTYNVTIIFWNKSVSFIF